MFRGLFVAVSISKIDSGFLSNWLKVEGDELQIYDASVWEAVIENWRKKKVLFGYFVILEIFVLYLDCKLDCCNGLGQFSTSWEGSQDICISIPTLRVKVSSKKLKKWKKNGKISIIGRGRGTDAGMNDANEVNKIS